MTDAYEIRHDSFGVTRVGCAIRVQIDGHYFDLLPEQALDFSSHLKRLVEKISGDAQA